MQIDQNEGQLEHRESNPLSKLLISTQILQDPIAGTFFASTSWLSFS